MKAKEEKYKDRINKMVEETALHNWRETENNDTERGIKTTNRERIIWRKFKKIRSNDWLAKCYLHDLLKAAKVWTSEGQIKSQQICGSQVPIDLASLQIKFWK